MSAQKEKIHQKLTRDKIPAILVEKNIICHTRVLEDEEYTDYLRKKLQEEVAEYLSAETSEQKLEELADVLEVIHAILRESETSFEKLELVRRAKFEECGGFYDRIFLEKTVDVKV
jgi:predicted house-cleaning noncanonical NTP pyrophosphatase (MazG superfamily)